MITRGYINIYIVICFSFLLGTLHAQKRLEYVGKGNWFVGVSGGGAWSLAENAHESYNVWMPTANILVGRNLNKSLSLRLSAGMAPQIGSPSHLAVQYFPELYRDYHFNVAEGYVDALFNILNHNRQYKESEIFDLYLSMGLGATYSFQFSSFVNEWSSEIYPVDTKEVLSPSARFSLIFAHHISRAWDLQYDFSIAGTSDGYNGVKRGGNATLLNLYTTFRISTLYYFRDSSTGKHRFGDTPRIVLDPYIMTEEADNYSSGDTLNTYIRFQLERDELSVTQHKVLKDVAKYMKSHPDYRFKVCGYPDSRIGSETTRLFLARQRVETVIQMLIKKMGVSTDRLEIEVNSREHPETVRNRWNVCGVVFVLL